MKSGHIWSYSGWRFPAFGLNTKSIQSECGKMWTRIILNTDTILAKKLHHKMFDRVLHAPLINFLMTEVPIV